MTIAQPPRSTDICIYVYAVIYITSTFAGGIWRALKTNWWSKIARASR